MREPYETPDDRPALRELAAAVEEGFGVPAGRMGNAGGGPAELLARTLGAPVLFFGTGLPEDRWHDSDERVSIAMLVNGAATLAHLWRRLGTGDRIEQCSAAAGGPPCPGSDGRSSGVPAAGPGNRSPWHE